MTYHPPKRGTLYIDQDKRGSFGFVTYVRDAELIRRILVRYVAETDMLVAAVVQYGKYPVEQVDHDVCLKGVHRMAIELGARVDPDWFSSPSVNWTRPLSDPTVPHEFTSSCLYIDVILMRTPGADPRPGLVVVGGSFDNRPFAPILVHIYGTDVTGIDSDYWKDLCARKPELSEGREDLLPLTDASFAPRVRDMILREVDESVSLIVANWEVSL